MTQLCGQGDVWICDVVIWDDNVVIWYVVFIVCCMLLFGVGDKSSGLEC